MKIFGEGLLRQKPGKEALLLTTYPDFSNLPFGLDLTMETTYVPHFPA